MTTDEQIEKLDLSELRRLMRLSLEASQHCPALHQELLHEYAALAARCGFELWSRLQARDCASGASNAQTLH
jgi:hypothetical protein